MNTTQNPVGDPENSFWDVNQGCHENIQNLAFAWFEIWKLLAGVSKTFSKNSCFRVLSLSPPTPHSRAKVSMLSKFSDILKMGNKKS